MLFLLKAIKMVYKPSSTINTLKLIPYVLIIPVILFQALSLSGCASTSPAIPSIYIVSLEPGRNLSTPTGVEVRIGYFGICGDDGVTRRCMSSAGGDVAAVTAAIFPTLTGHGNGNGTKSKAENPAPISAAEAHDLVLTALNLQSQIFISILAGSAFLFVVGTVCLFLFKRDVAKHAQASPLDRPRRRSIILRRGTYGALYLSLGLVFAASLATTETADALQFASRATGSAAILMHAGRTVQVLQWMAFGFSTLFAMAVPMLVRPGSPGAAASGKELA